MHDIPRILSSVSFNPPHNSQLGIPSFIVYNPVIPATLQGYFEDFLYNGNVNGMLNKSMIYFLGFISSDKTCIEQPYLSWNEYQSKRKYYNLLGIRYLVDYNNAFFNRIENELNDIKRIKLDDPKANERITILEDTRALPRALFHNKLRNSPAY